mmetsp:Transcript_68587/g.223110  ORF Transcript_68587/g.223110 Transcript_68587/m.223110 type:complete len:216 (-) Transcript_68587:489-1136(-)
MACTPACCAGLPGKTFMTMAPFLTPKTSVKYSGARTTPNEERLTKPLEIMLPTLRLTVSMGMARPMPEKVPVEERMAEFRPMTLPSLSSRGPPLFPGLIDASVWITPRMGRPGTPDCMVRERPLMTPRLMLCSRPKGLPRAKTACPGSNVSETPLPSGTMRPARIKLSPLTSSTAISDRGSAPTMVAAKLLCLSSPLASFVMNTTCGLFISSTTW